MDTLDEFAPRGNNGPKPREAVVRYFALRGFEKTRRTISDLGLDLEDPAVNIAAYESGKPLHRREDDLDLSENLERIEKEEQHPKLGRVQMVRSRMILLVSLLLGGAATYAMLQPHDPEKPREVQKKLLDTRGASSQDSQVKLIDLHDGGWERGSQPPAIDDKVRARSR